MIIMVGKYLTQVFFNNIFCESKDFDLFLTKLIKTKFKKPADKLHMHPFQMMPQKCYT